MLSYYTTLGLNSSSRVINYTWWKYLLWQTFKNASEPIKRVLALVNRWMPVLPHASPTDLRILNRLCRYRGINLEKCRDRNAIDPIVAQPRPLLMKSNVSICYGTWSMSLLVLMCLINAVSPGDESLQSTSVSVRPVGYFVPVVTLYLNCCQEFSTHQTSPIPILYGTFRSVWKHLNLCYVDFNGCQLFWKAIVDFYLSQRLYFKHVHVGSTVTFDYVFRDLFKSGLMENNLITTT